MTTTTKTIPAATTKQLDLISDLMGKKFFDADAQAKFDAEFTDYKSSVKTASSLISFMFKLPLKETVANRFNPEPGMYRMDDALYRVKVSRTGNWYAEVAVKPEPESGRKSLKWDYLGKRVNLSTAEALSDAEAGKFVGYCVRCNAELTVLESIERGMGPVCAKKV